MALGLGASFAAGGAVEGLQQVIAQKLREEEAARRASVDLANQEHAAAELAARQADQDRDADLAQQALDYQQFRDINLDMEKVRAQNRAEADAQIREIDLDLLLKSGLVDSPETRSELLRLGQDPTKVFTKPPDPSYVWQTKPDGSQVRVLDAPGLISARSPRQESPTQDFSRTLRLQQDWDRTPIVQEHRSIGSTISKMRAALTRGATDSSGLPAAAEAIQVLFQKALDKDSVVREGEFFRSFMTQPVINKMRGFMERYAGKGGTGIPFDVLASYVDLVEGMQEAIYQDMVRASHRVRATADAFSVDPSLVFGQDLDAPMRKTGTARPSATTPATTPPARRGGRIERQPDGSFKWIR
jgi:hypothetical protein